MIEVHLQLYHLEGLFRVENTGSQQTDPSLLLQTLIHFYESLLRIILCRTKVTCECNPESCQKDRPSSAFRPEATSTVSTNNLAQCQRPATIIQQLVNRSARRLLILHCLPPTHLPPSKLPLSTNTQAAPQTNALLGLYLKLYNITETNMVSITTNQELLVFVSEAASTTMHYISAMSNESSHGQRKFQCV